MKPIAKDALVFFTNGQNPVNNLSSGQVQKIYQGHIKSWAELGGQDTKITAFQRNEDSGSQVLMRKLVMDGLEMIEPEEELIEMFMGGMVESVIKYDNNENAIGYSVYYYLKAFIEEGENIKIFDIDEVEASNKNISNGKYPFTENFYVVIRKSEEDSSPARKIYDYLTTNDGKKFINSCGYVALP
jgi:phosphate transport system substrate-binding protein